MSSESDCGEISDKPKKRKGVTNEETYKRNVIKKARVKGESYTSYKGKNVHAKIQDTFNCKCAERCYSNVSEESKSDLWEYFYSLCSKNEQDTFLQSLIERREPKRRRRPNGTEKPEVDENVEEDMEQEESRNKDKRQSKEKHNFFTYHVKIDGHIQEVCKNTFMKLYGITVSRVRRLCNLLIAGKSPRDLRGKSRSGNAINGEICQLIYNHIAKYEVKETHYGGRQKKYLDARLSIKVMHNMFLEANPECKNKVKYDFFREFFNENFNYSFGRPQIDVCSTCEGFSMKMKDRNLSDNAKRNVAAEQMLHKRRAKKFYSALQVASENEDDDTVALAFDFMATQPLPRIPVQEVYYLRQLSVNIFCIHNLKTDIADLYLYHEGQASKSPNEVCTFLWQYIQTLPSSVKKLHLFSDGTGGQNKNHTVVRFLLSLCDTGRFDCIIHFFPVRGHSFMPCDRDFGSLKRFLNKTDRIYLVEQYGELFLRSGKEGRFKLHYVETETIINFHTWWPRFYKKTVCSEETAGRGIPKMAKVTFKVSTYRQFIYKNENKGTVTAKEFIGGLTSNTFSLAKTEAAPILPSLKAYPMGKIPINAKKIADIGKLKNYIIGYEDFYDEILNWPSTTAADCSDDDGTAHDD